MGAYTDSFGKLNSVAHPAQRKNKSWANGDALRPSWGILARAHALLWLREGGSEVAVMR